MLPVKETKHVETARDLLIGQFKKRRVIQGFLDTYVRRIQSVEDAIWSVIDARVLDTATNAQLDSLGDLVGEQRLGRTDAMYRASIRLRIRVNRSKGRIIDVIDVASLASTSTIDPAVTEYQYLGFEVDLFSLVGERYVAELLSKTRAATSYGLLVASDLPRASLLIWDDVVSPDASIQTFSDAASGTGRVCESGYGLPTDFSGIVLGAAPVFSPATLALSGWWRANFTGSPWTPTASAGTSGANGNLSEATNPPAVGAALAGKTPADFDGTNDQLANPATISTFVGASSGSIVSLFWADTAVADPGVGSYYLEPSLFSDAIDGFSSLSFSASGARFGCFNGVNFNAVTASCATGGWHLAQVRWDAATIEIRIDSGAWQTLARTVTLSTASVRVGRNYDTAFFDGKILETMTALVRMSDANFDSIKSYVNATYGLAL